MDKITHEMRMKQWTPVIRECRSSGMAVKSCKRYLSLLYERLHKEIYRSKVLQADETPVLINKDDRPAGSKSYLWVYRTGKMLSAAPIVLYEYQKTRKTDHPREFLKDYNGTVVTDGYQVYHTLEKEREDLRIAVCWSVLAAGLRPL